MIEVKPKIYIPSNQMKKGFTLLELLIVITIIAILSVILILVLNPVEIVRKSRDVQRMSDLATLKTAISIYSSTVATPYLDGSNNSGCWDGIQSPHVGAKLYVSYPDTLGGGDDIDDVTPPIQFSQAFTSWHQISAAASNAKVDGTGWIPVHLTDITGGSPISNLPVDPINTVGDVSVVDNSDLMYRYGCIDSPLDFEIDARLESLAYGVLGTEDKAAKDGGNNANLYEVGSNLLVLPSGVLDNF